MWRNKVYTEYRTKNDKRSLKPDVIHTENKDHKIDNVFYSTYYYRKSFEKIKEQLLNNQEYYINYFKDKFKITIEFNVTTDETRISTIDRFNNRRDYDINFDTQFGSKLLLYRMYSEARSTMLHAEEVKSTPASTIKRLMQAIYNDTITN